MSQSASAHRIAAFDWSFRKDLKIKLTPLAVQAAEKQDFFVVGRRRRPRAFAEAGGSFEPPFLQKNGEFGRLVRRVWSITYSQRECAL